NFATPVTLRRAAATDRAMSQAMPTLPTSRAHEPLGDPALRRTVERFVRRRGPPAHGEDVGETGVVGAPGAPERPPPAAGLSRWRGPRPDVGDGVQTVFVDALAASERPTEPAELSRWLLGIARHKVVDRHRRATREHPAELPELPANPPPIEARALVRWAERQV